VRAISAVCLLPADACASASRAGGIRANKKVLSARQWSNLGNSWTLVILFYRSPVFLRLGIKGLERLIAHLLGSPLGRHRIKL
jgi:hypothetical protein